MNQHYLMSKMKSTGIAYLCWFFIGVHYAYLGKWFYQILFWLTLGGFGIWWVIDLFHIPTKIENYNYKVAKEIEKLEQQKLIKA